MGPFRNRSSRNCFQSIAHSTGFEPFPRAYLSRGAMSNSQRQLFLIFIFRYVYAVTVYFPRQEDSARFLQKMEGATFPC
jgi:hypothetical protein